MCLNIDKIDTEKHESTIFSLYRSKSLVKETVTKKGELKIKCHRLIVPTRSIFSLKQSNRFVEVELIGQCGCVAMKHQLIAKELVPFVIGMFPTTKHSGR